METGCNKKEVATQILCAILRRMDIRDLEELEGLEGTIIIPPEEKAAAVTEHRIRKVGAKPRYATPEQMIPIIEDFFEYCIQRNQPPLVTTLALALGFSCRTTLDDYMRKPEFHDVVKRAKLVCEDWAAKGLVSGKNTVGFIFLLKQHGWRDIQENVTTIETHEQRIARLIKDNGGGER